MANADGPEMFSLSKKTSNEGAEISSRCFGGIIALHGSLLTGWAFDPREPDLRLAVEIEIDGACVALVRADQLQDLAQDGDTPAGDGCHGFSCELKPSWLYGAKWLAARIANQGPWLAGQVDLTDAASEAPPKPRGQVYYLGGLSLAGWIYDPADWNRVLSVRILEDDAVLVVQNADRPERCLADCENPNHGFRIDLPWGLADGCLHQLNIETTDGQLLPGSPIQLLEITGSIVDLLHRHWPREARPAAFYLIQDLLREEQRQCPGVTGFSHYSRWRELYQPLVSEQTDNQHLRLGVLLYGPVDTDNEAQQRSRASLNSQQLLPVQVACVDDASLLRGLRHLIAENLDAVALLRTGDRLAPTALSSLASVLLEADTGSSRAAWVYCDCDRDGSGKERIDPWFKPAWDPDLFLGVDLISSGVLFGTAILRAALACLADKPSDFAPDPEASWHWLLAAVVAATQERREPVAHLPEALYWRAANTPTDPSRRSFSPSRQRAIHWLANRWELGARVTSCPDHPGLLRVQWPLPHHLPTVSLIVPTRDGGERLRTCVQGLISKTRYPKLEVIVVDNDSRDPGTLAYLDQLADDGITVLRYPRPFNYAAINNLAAAAAKGEILGLVNDDVEVLDPDWMHEMVRELTRSGVGIVGAKLLWPNDMVQHGGVTVGINGLAGHVGNHWMDAEAGYLGCNQITRRYSAVTGACLVCHKELYINLGGLDAIAFPVTFNDVDFCLRAYEHGVRILWTPAARLRHAESASRGKDEQPAQRARAKREQRLFMERWRTKYSIDPYYHPGLNHDLLTGPFCGLLPVPLSRKARMSPG